MLPAEIAREIRRRSEALDYVFEGSILIPGSPCRVACQYLPNYRITVDETSRKLIADESMRSYKEEWEQSDDSYHRAINTATSETGLEFNNNHLNDTIGNSAMRLALEMLEHKEDISVVDIGAGDGYTTKAMVDQLCAIGLDEVVLPKCTFYLLEPSGTALEKATKTLKGLRARVVPLEWSIQEYFLGRHEAKFDMAISNAVFHHMTFPDYLEWVHSRLADDGVMVVGDWHTKLWSHPVFLLPILRELRIDDKRIRTFEGEFGIMKGDDERERKKLSADETRDNAYVLDFNIRLAKILRGQKDGARLYLLEAMEGLSERLEKYEEAGFTVDMKELKEKHRAFARMPRNMTKHKGMELGTVVAMGKIK